MNVNGIEFTVEEFLGKGKSGFSFLVTDSNSNKFCIKKIHHEPCEYYEFGDKLQSEINDYNILIDLIPIPKLLDVDYDNEILLKEYIPGQTIQELIDDHNDINEYIEEIRNIAKICKLNNLNIDYYPTNFIFYNGKLMYLDYECNEYSDKWNFENWGIKYWIK